MKFNFATIRRISAIAQSSQMERHSKCSSLRLKVLDDDVTRNDGLKVILAYFGELLWSRS